MAVQLARRAAARLFFAVEAATVGDELACGVLGHDEVAEAGGGASVFSGSLGAVSLLRHSDPTVQGPDSRGSPADRVWAGIGRRWRRLLSKTPGSRWIHGYDAWCETLLLGACAVAAASA